jgi:hypothetical protein
MQLDISFTDFKPVWQYIFGTLFVAFVFWVIGFFTNKRFKQHDSTIKLLKILQDILFEIREEEDISINTNTKRAKAHINQSVNEAGRLYNDIRHIWCINHFCFKKRFFALYGKGKNKNEEYTQYKSFGIETELEVRNLVRARLVKLIKLLK